MDTRLYQEYQRNPELSDKVRTLHVGQDNPIQISTGHRIQHHDGKCSRPHGHNYEIIVEISGSLTAEGWVVDKGDVTEIIGAWDHKFLLEEGDPLAEAFEHAGDADSVVTIPYPPTAEVMGVLLERKLLDALPDTVSDVRVEVSETGELCATH